MKYALTIEEIQTELEQVSKKFNDYCVTLSDEQFFYQPLEKWSVAQQVKHLTKATTTSCLAFSLPKFVVRIVGGKPNRSSRSYDELVTRYNTKLEQGGKASGRYIPEPVSISAGKERLLNEFNDSMKKMKNLLAKKWKDPQPDLYLAPHPLLGKITLRELCYFTIHHTLHHLGSIQKLCQK